MEDIRDNYKEQIVAFIDILGFKNIIEKIPNSTQIHKKIHRALKDIHSYKSYSLDPRCLQSELKITVFSDSIVLTGDVDKMHYILWSSTCIQSRLLGYGILTRGGVSKGLIYHEHNIFYGIGFLNAYKLESEIAIYPRIIIDPILLENISKKSSSLISKDIDNIYYIDPFSIPNSIGNADELLADGYDPHEEFLKEIGKHLNEQISNAKDLKHKSKLEWLFVKHNTASKDYLSKRKTRWH